MFFKLSEKQPVVLLKQPIVLLLGIFEKVENCFGWLTCCQTKTINCFVLSIDCLFENPNKICFVSWVCFKWFSNWMCSCFKCFVQSLKAINSLFMLYNKQGKRKTDLSFSEIAFKIWTFTIQLWFFQESGIGLHLYWFQFIL